MKSNKRLLLVLSLVVGLLGVSTAAASAAVWKHGGSNLAAHTEIGLTGGELFETGTSGMSCEVLATITTSGGSTGTITKWEVNNCGGGFGELTGCEVAATEPKGLNWTLHINETDISITSMRIRRTFKTGCPIKELDKTVTMTLTPDVPSAISEFEFHGSATSYTSFGSFTVDSPNAGTYGIG